MQIQKYIRLLLLPVFITLLCSCSENVPTSPLTISSSPWPGYEPLYLGRDLGIINQDKVKLFELPSLDVALESFRNHSTDLATLTLDQTLDLIHSGINLRILLIMDISNGGDAVVARPEIKNLKDLKGKRISVVNTPLGSYMLSRLLDKAGLQKSDIKIFTMPETHQVEFYEKDKADAFITYDPVKSQLQKLGLKVLFDSADIPNEIFDLLVAHEEVYQKRFNDLCDIGTQWFKTLYYIKQNKNESAVYMGKRLGVNVDEYNEMMKGLIIPNLEENKKLFSGSSPAILQSANKLADIMLSENQLTKKINPGVAIDNKYVGCINQ